MGDLLVEYSTCRRPGNITVPVVCWSSLLADLGASSASGGSVANPA